LYISQESLMSLKAPLASATRVKGSI